LNGGEVQWEHAWEIHGGAPLVVRPLRIKGIACIFYVVLLGSPTSSITLVSYLREIPTAAVLHHPFLFGEIPT